MSAAPTVAPRADTALRRRVLRRLRAQPSAREAVGILVLIVVVALLAPLLAPHDPHDFAALHVLDARLPPGEQGAAGVTFWLGSDAKGLDMLSAILYGLRTSLFVGASATAGALLVGVTAGLVAAQSGGWLDTLLLRVTDFIVAFPALLVALALLAAVGRGVDSMIIAIVVVQWATYARLMRAAAMDERRKAYMEAAVNQGLPTLYAVRTHLLPNSVGPVLAAATTGLAGGITLEATLSFLGVGLPETEPSLGLLVAGGFESLLSGEYWISFFPGLALLVLILAINVVGERLRRDFGARRH